MAGAPLSPSELAEVRVMLQEWRQHRAMDTLSISSSGPSEEAIQEAFSVRQLNQPMVSCGFSWKPIERNGFLWISIELKEVYLRFSNFFFKVS